jgi:hypothetical protein
LWTRYTETTLLRLKVQGGEILNAVVMAMKIPPNSDFFDDDTSMEQVVVYRSQYTQDPNDWVRNLCNHFHIYIFPHLKFKINNFLYLTQINLYKHQVIQFAEDYQLWIRSGGFEHKYQDLYYNDFFISAENLPVFASSVAGNYIYQGYQQGSALWHNEDIANINCARVWLDNGFYWHFGSVSQYEAFDDTSSYCRSSNSHYDRPYESLFWTCPQTPPGFISFIHLEPMASDNDNDNDDIDPSPPPAGGPSTQTGLPLTNASSRTSGRPRSQTLFTQPSYTQRGALSRPSTSSTKKRTHSPEHNETGAKKGGGARKKK